MPVDYLDSFLVLVADCAREHRIVRWRAVDSMAWTVLIVGIIRISFFIVLFLTDKDLAISDLFSHSLVLHEVLLIERVVSVDFRLRSGFPLLSVGQARP